LPGLFARLGIDKDFLMLGKQLPLKRSLIDVGICCHNLLTLASRRDFGNVTLLKVIGGAVAHGFCFIRYRDETPIAPGIKDIT
jgi:hypothetical protein